MAEVRSIVDEVDPGEAYKILRDDQTAVLIDVRTRAEWAFVGLPDLARLGREVWPLEWVSFPAMARNPAFVGDVIARTGGSRPRRLLFICRSGSRSMAAAREVAQACNDRGVPVQCTNVAEGFEGDLDSGGHRGRLNGWKNRGLPWRQS